MNDMNELGDLDRESDAVVTRSEEELRIYTRRRETQRARLVKDVEIETQTRTVEVRHERVRVEYEPVVEGDRQPSFSGSAAGGDEWLVLYDEEVVMQTRWVPRERVRLAVHAVMEDREISEDLRGERIEIDDTTHGDEHV